MEIEILLNILLLFISLLHCKDILYTVKEGSWLTGREHSCLWGAKMSYIMPHAMSGCEKRTWPTCFTSAYESWVRLSFRPLTVRNEMKLAWVAAKTKWDRKAGMQKTTSRICNREGSTNASYEKWVLHDDEASSRRQTDCNITTAITTIFILATFCSGRALCSWTESSCRVKRQLLADDSLPGYRHSCPAKWHTKR